MKAVILEDANVFRVDEKVDPTPSLSEALVRVRHTGICATDVAMIRGLSPLAVAPITPGHDWVGTIEDAPSGSGYAHHVKESISGREEEMEDIDVENVGLY